MTQQADACPNCGAFAVVRTKIPGRKGQPGREVFTCSSCGQGAGQLEQNAKTVNAQRAAATKRRAPTAADRARARRGNRS
jgi:transcription elongation factor Elf1